MAVVAASPAFAQSPAAIDPLAAAFANARRLVVEGESGVPLAVVEAGDRDAPAVVFIHGYRQSTLAWYRQFASDLSTRCHLVAFDLRGHGDSGAPWSADAYADPRVWATDLARVIAATGARRPLVVAWSFGGLVAMDWLRGGPTDLAGLVLVSSTGQLLPRAPGAPALPSPPPLGTRVATARAAADRVYGPGVDPAIRAALAEASLRTGPFVDAGTATRARTLDNSDLVDRVRALQVTLVVGEDDAIVPRATSEALRRTLTRARVVEIPGAGHAPFIDHADRFDALLEELQCHR